MKIEVAELADLKDFLKKRFPDEKDKKDIFVDITAHYAKFDNDNNLIDSFVYTIQCSVPFIRYYIYFREKELEKLGFRDPIRVLRYKITDPILIEELKRRESLIKQAIDI